MADQTVPEDEDLFAVYNSCAKPVEEEPPVPFVGLRNLGNSCFFNSVVQVLLHCPDFQNFLDLYAAKAEKFIAAKNKELHTIDDSANPTDGTVKKCKILLELQKLGENIRKRQFEIVEKGCGNGESGSGNAIEPGCLLVSLRAVCPYFEPYAQQDAQECLRCLLDILNESISFLSNKSESTSFLKNNPIKVLGGSKSGGVVNLSYTNNSIHSRDFRQPVFKESKTTAARKRGARSLFKNPLKRIRESEKENVVPFKKITPKVLFTVAEKETKPPKNTVTKSNPVSILTPKIESKRKASAAVTLKRKVQNALPAELKGIFSSQSKKHISHVSETPPDLDEMDSEVTALSLSSQTTPPPVENGAPSCNGSFFELEDGKNFVEALFQGELVNETRCVECEGCGRRVESFMDVSLPVKQDEKPADNLEQLIFNHSTEDTEPQSKCSVTWGMTAYTSREILDGENKYYCDTCKRYCDGERRLLLHKLPPIVTFHLKRFTSCADSGDNFGISVSKINTCFDVPHEMSLNEWCSTSCQSDSKYRLFAMIVHSGTTVCSGHYLAYIKLQCLMNTSDNLEALNKIKSYDGGWLEADDERVRIISDEKLKEITSPDSSEDTSRTPYLLFYCKDQ